MIGKRWLGLGIAALCSAGLHAQTPSRPTMPKVPERLVLFSRAEVRIADSNCDLPDEVWLVIDDVDRFPYELPGSGRVRRLDELEVEVDPRDTQASIYVPHAMRTDCVKGMPDWDNQRVIYTFPRCSSSAVQDITISTSHQISISYVRHLPAGDPGTVPCRAHASFRTHEPYSVKPPLRDGAEDLVLQLGLTQPRLDTPGLSLREILRLTRGLKKDQSVPLDEEWMIHVLSVQRVRGDGSVPNVSPAAIDLDIRAVRELGSPTLTLNIEKFEQKKK